MKKFLLACAVALPLLTLTQTKASAWINFNLSAGVNIGFQCGKNKNCGAAQTVQTIDPAAAYPSYGYPAYAVPTTTASSDSSTAPAPSPTFPPKPMPTDSTQKGSSSSSFYQPASYYENAPANYYDPGASNYYNPGGTYYYPGAWMPYSQVPSYWYGR